MIVSFKVLLFLSEILLFWCFNIYEVQLERRVSGYRDRDLLVSPIWVETDRLLGSSLGMLSVAMRECSD